MCTVHNNTETKSDLSLSLSFSQLCCVVIKRKKKKKKSVCTYIIIINYKNVFFIYFTVVFNGSVNFAFLGGLQAEEAERV